MIKELQKSRNLFDESSLQNGYYGGGDTTYSVYYPDDRYRGFSLNLNAGIYTLNITCDVSVKLLRVSTSIDGKVEVATDDQPYTFTLTGDAIIYVSFRNQTTTNNFPNLKVMLNTGETPLPYKPYGDTWNTKSYAKIVDTTQQVTSFPVVVRPMENAIPSWTIKGNLVQDGTPSPSNIIYPSETGDRTENLFDRSTEQVGYFVNTNGTLSGNQPSWIASDYVEIEENTEYTFVPNSTAGNAAKHCFYDSNKQPFVSYIIDSGAQTFTTPVGAKYARFSYRTSSSNVMLNTGSTALPYQPYGYKLTISSANTTTPVYLGEVETTRKIFKYEFNGSESWKFGSYPYIDKFLIYGKNYLRQKINICICSHLQTSANVGSGDSIAPDTCCFNIDNSDGVFYYKDTSVSDLASFKSWLQQQYANGTPVTVWYVLATPQTAVVNEPIRKIGDYADTVSGTNLSVTAQSPTTIDVNTSLKPSEMDLTYTGKKMCKRKKAVRTANIYNKYNTIDIPNFGVRYGVYCELGNYAIYNDTDNNVYWFTDNGVARFLACSPHSTSTVSISGSGLTGFYMPYNDSSLGEVTIVQGSTVPDHYIPYLDWS